MHARATALNSITFCALAVYLVLAAASFSAFVEPSLNGTISWRVYADSRIYMDLGDSIRLQGGGTAFIALISLARNMIVPSFLAVWLQTATNIAVFNVIIFFAALVLLARTFSHFKWHVFLPIVLASPTTYEALLTLNKEIFVLFCAVVLARWFKTRSNLLMLCLILFSAALRWEQAFAIFCFLILLGLKVSPKRAAVAMIVGISLTYPLAMASVNIGSDVKQSSSSALFAQINVLQSYGLYFLLFVPKMIIALLSHVVQFWMLFLNRERLHDLPTGVFVLIDQICMCFVIVISLCRKLWVGENPVVYFIMVYCLIFIAAPENSPRYLYLLFVLMTVVLSSPEMQSLRLPVRAPLGLNVKKLMPAPH
jgi:hypothetical protein